MKLNLTRVADIVGMIGITAFYPLQNLALFKSQDPTGLSLPAFMSLLVGCAGFTVLGFRTKAYGLLAANLVGFSFTVAIIAGILAWG